MADNEDGIVMLPETSGDGSVRPYRASRLRPGGADRALLQGLALQGQHASSPRRLVLPVQRDERAVHPRPPAVASTLRGSAGRGGNILPAGRTGDLA
ncbi:hypothetical protein HBB16_11490 [Pseudonocardia sp. MCCB 268]|nr:hypothetical protein [Pseudonocardia cytotoxica]